MTFNKVRQSAHQGDARSQYNLGTLYFNGDDDDAERDPTKAAHWWKKAAEQGHVEAQCKLGTLYYNGEGDVEKNLKEAAIWLEQAAKKGNAQAQAQEKLMEEEVKDATWMTSCLFRGWDKDGTLKR